MISFDFSLKVSNLRNFNDGHSFQSFTWKIFKKLWNWPHWLTWRLSFPHNRPLTGRRPPVHNFPAPQFPLQTRPSTVQPNFVFKFSSFLCAKLVQTCAILNNWLWIQPKSTMRCLDLWPRSHPETTYKMWYQVFSFTLQVQSKDHTSAIIIIRLFQYSVWYSYKVYYP